MSELNLPRLGLGLAVLVLAACAHTPALDHAPQVTAPDPLFRTPPASISTIAAWRDGDGKPWVVIADDRLGRAQMIDGTTGHAAVQSAEARGEVSELLAPTAMHIAENWLFVAEKDSPRLHILALPSLESLGTLAHAGELAAPVAVWAEHIRRGWFRVFVGDLGQPGTAARVSNDHGGGLLRVWQVRQRTNGRLAAWHAMTLGGLDEDTPFGEPRALSAHRAGDTLLFVDGAQARVRRMRMDGRATIQPIHLEDVVSLGFRECGGETGYWIAAFGDGGLRTLDAEELRPREALPLWLSGPTRQVVWLAPSEKGRGRLYALADDGSVSAYEEEELDRIPGWSCE